MCFPRSVHSQRRLVARGGLDAWSDPKDPLVPSDPFPPFVCGAGPLGLASTTKGGFGCVGVGRMAESACANQPSADEPDYQAHQESQWSGNEDAQHRTLIGVGRENHRPEEAERESDASHDQRPSECLSHVPAGCRPCAVTKGDGTREQQQERDDHAGWTSGPRDGPRTVASRSAATRSGSRCSRAGRGCSSPARRSRSSGPTSPRTRPGPQASRRRAGFPEPAWTRAPQRPR